MSILDSGQFHELNTSLPVVDGRLFSPIEIGGILERLNGRYQTAALKSDSQLCLMLEMAIQCCQLYQSIQRDVVSKQEMVQTTVHHLASLNTQLQNLLSSIQINATEQQNGLSASQQSENWDQIEHWFVSATRDATNGSQIANKKGDSPPNLQETESTAVSPDLTIYCLGTFRIFYQHQQYKEINGIKGQLLKYLLLNRDKPISKEKLIDIFWPDADIEAAPRNLHQAVYQLRQLLRKFQPEKRFILFEDDHYRLNPDLNIHLDVETFLNHVENGHLLMQKEAPDEAMKQYSIAELMYQGQFLEDVPYEDWPKSQRQQLHAHYQSMTTQLITFYLEQQSFTAVIALSQKRLQFESCDEFAHQQLMQSYMAQGQRHMAIRQYQRCAEALNQELGILPSPKTEALYLKIIQ